MGVYSFPDVYVERQQIINTDIAQSGAYIGGFIGQAARGVRNKAVLITSWTEYIETFANGLDNPFKTDGNIISYLPYAVYGFFQNGGTACYVVNACYHGVKATGTVGGISVSAVDEGAWGNKLFIKVTPSTTATDTVTVSVYLGDSATTDTLVEEFKDVTLTNIVDSINGISEFITVSAPTEFSNAEATALAGGKEDPWGGNAMLLKNILNDQKVFDGIDDIAMLSYVDSGTLTDNTELLNYCDARGDIHAVLGVSSATVKPENVDNDIPKAGRMNAYYPWIGVADPSTGAVVNIPNCGHIQGMIVRMTETYGLHKVPAGTNAVIRGAVSLATDLGRTDAGKLNDDNVCCIITKPNYGIVCWGGRSRFEGGRYITSVLLETRITRDAYEGLQPFIFEPNTSKTWKKVESSLSKYLREHWTAGVLEGNTELEAFRVVCDNTTNTEKTIAKKQLIAEVAYREKDCAEFVIVKLSRTMQ